LIKISFIGDSTKRKKRDNIDSFASLHMLRTASTAVLNETQSGHGMQIRSHPGRGSRAF